MRATFLCLLALHVAPAYGQTPTIEQMIGLKRASQVRISPDGKQVAYVVSETDWDDNEVRSHIWISRVGRTDHYQLTTGKKSCRSPRWALDSKRIAFLSDRDGKTQIYLISVEGGEAVRLTNHDSAVSSFEWSANNRQIAFTAAEGESKERKERREKFGSFEVFEEDHGRMHLWSFYLSADRPEKPVKAERLSGGEAFSVGSFAWGGEERIAFSATRDPLLTSSPTSTIYTVKLADKSVKKIVETPGPHRNPAWSVDCKQIAFETANGSEHFFHTNTYIAVVPAEGGKPVVMTEKHDERVALEGWGADGIVFSTLYRTTVQLYQIVVEEKSVTRVCGGANANVHSNWSFTPNYRQVAFLYADANEYPEVCVTEVPLRFPLSPTATLTEFRKQLTPFKLAQREVIRWKSTDGVEIEGVLIKPADYNRFKKYPLLVVIHGGPTGVDTPALRGEYAYPVERFCAKEALVLKPNYRGSAGYGEKFRSLNVRNLGLGDYQDVISGVDHLIDRGMVDRNRVGAMGWSQGGYISAFITCYSDRFKAVSVGAGISDWMTYYSNTDIPLFTRQYLRATPWDDPEIYRKTSPISYLDRAKTPTLIQHGDQDKRVPIANAYQLYRGLKDKSVPVKLIVYKGAGHGISKPKEQRALMEQNYEWFCEHLWGEKPKK